MINKLNVFDLTSLRIAHLNERQKVINENLANANTPGYRARDLKKFDEMLQNPPKDRLKPVRTSLDHMASLFPPVSPYGEAEDRFPYEESPDRNTVILEEQMVKAADTQSHHEMMLGVFRKNMALLRMAIGNR
jgi:flagellar basal-body rod protein FlgB